MTEADPALDRYFAGSYRQGRDNFLAACQQAGLTVDSHVHPDLKGPEGEDLAMDAVWIGPKDASRVLVVSCGTHGLEAAAGSATMLRWLEMDGPGGLPADMAMLMVHAVNPFGWAWARRGNEDGIDLNRNFLDHAAPYPANPGYAELHPALLRAGVEPVGLEAFAATFHSLAASKGLDYALTGITSGQYEFPDGLSYGGNAPSWSCETLYAIARKYLGRADRLLHIDWHTGIGPYGQPHFILDEGKDSKAYGVLASWWPDHAIHCDDVVEGVSISYNGILVDGFRQQVTALAGARMLNITIEWGTYEVERMIGALVMDNWLAHRSKDADPELVRQVRAQLVELFYPRAAEWRQNVLKASEGLYTQAIDGLNSWAGN